jgi:hypothetical protein
MANDFNKHVRTPKTILAVMMELQQLKTAIMVAEYQGDAYDVETMLTARIMELEKKLIGGNNNDTTKTRTI